MCLPAFLKRQEWLARHLVVPSCWRNRFSLLYRARIFKLLRIPGIDSTESIPYNLSPSSLVNGHGASNTLEVFSKCHLYPSSSRALALAIYWMGSGIYFFISIPIYSVPGIDPLFNPSKNLVSELSWAKMEVSHTLLTWDGGGGYFWYIFGSLIFWFLTKSRANLAVDLNYFGMLQVRYASSYAKHVLYIVTEFQL